MPGPRDDSPVAVRDLRCRSAGRPGPDAPPGPARPPPDLPPVPTGRVRSAQRAHGGRGRVHRVSLHRQCV